MSHYSIRDLEHLSGIKAHTLRIWEQRYNLLRPKRTPTNIRFYDNDDLKLLLNVSVLNEHGYRISRIAGMNRDEMLHAVSQLSQDLSHFPDQIQSLSLAMIDMDAARFEGVMSSNIQRSGLERTMLDIVYPFLTRIGILWQTGVISPAQEHFISNLIRQKLISSIDTLPTEALPGAKRFVLFLPEGELHEIGLLFASYLLKARSHEVMYLGQSLPVDDLFSVCKLVKPDYVFGIFNANANFDERMAYFNRLVNEMPDVQVLAGGSLFASSTLDTSARYKILTGAKAFVELLEELAAVTTTSRQGTTYTADLAI